MSLTATKLFGKQTYFKLARHDNCASFFLKNQLSCKKLANLKKDSFSYNVYFQDCVCMVFQGYVAPSISTTRVDPLEVYNE